MTQDPNAQRLRRAGLDAAREARTVLAALIGADDSVDSATRERLAGVVGALFGAEIGNERQIHDALHEASTALSALLALSQDRPNIATRITRALAMMHSAKEELGRRLAPEREDSTAPFLLSASRMKGGDTDGPERRETSRLEVEVEVGLSGDTRFFTGVTGDVSPGGLFVATDEPLSVGTELGLAFVLPDGYRVSAVARVAWVRAPRYREGELPAGMGLHFEALSDKDLRAIQYFLTQRPAFRYGDV